MLLVSSSALPPEMASDRCGFVTVATAEEENDALITSAPSGSCCSCFKAAVFADAAEADEPLFLFILRFLVCMLSCFRVMGRGHCKERRRKSCLISAECEENKMPFWRRPPGERGNFAHFPDAGAAAARIYGRILPHGKMEGH